MHILYTTSDEFEGVVFAEKAKAESVARIYDACRTATTWREFRDLLSEDEFEEVLVNNELDQAGLDLDAGFDAARDIAGYADGFYPDWLQSDMLDWFPKDIAARYGSDQQGTLNGEILMLPADLADQIATDLALRGHKVDRSELFFY
ncbi:MAG: hypothetical protein AAGC63_16345 [Propionicimonas sp.]|nr:hypothetical protein [Propionicimonas sp.]